MNTKQVIEMPTLSEDFFKSHPQPIHLLDDKRMIWTNEILPVCVWDNSLIIAGHKAPTTLPPETIYLYASPESLSHWTSQKQSSLISDISAKLLSSDEVFSTLKSKPEYQKELSSLFDLIKEQYAGVALLELSKNHKQVRITDSSGQWATNISDSVIDISEPCVFRIVATTDKSFHGPVSQSPANDAFFKASLKGQYPENLTIVPLIYHDEQCGMLLCYGPKDTNTLQTLRQIEKLGSQFIDRLMNENKINSEVSSKAA